jgi:hypothetical protein
MSDQVADVLDDAADLLEREGWIQHASYSLDGGACSVGAVAAVVSRKHLPVVMEDAATNAVQDYLDYRYDDADIVAWNDAPGRTKQQVLDAFRAAAKQERMRPETPAPPGTPDPRGVGVGLAGGDAETRTRPADESHPPR